MIGFRINEEFLDLDKSTRIQMQVNNPLFNQDFEKGVLTYDISAPATPTNQRLLQYAGSLSIRSFQKATVPCQMWLHNQLWRVGKLRVLELSGGKYRFSFQTDAGDLDTVGSDKLRSLALGTASFGSRAGFAVFPVLNQGSATINSGGPSVPFPYLVHILQQVLGLYGYTVHGSWLEEPETMQRVIFNTVAAPSEVQFQQHLPDITVGEFLKRIRKRYGLALVFKTKTKELHLVKLVEALADPAYDDWTHLTQRGVGWRPNTSDGFTLKELIDSDDALQKDKPESFGTLVYGNGVEPIDTGVGSTLMSGSTPFVSMKTGNYAEASKFGFRVLQHVNGSGAAETWDSLQAAHLEWLAFRTETEGIARTLQLTTAHLLNLDPLRKKLIVSEEGVMKAFWESIDMELDMTGQIKAKVNFLKVMQ